MSIVRVDGDSVRGIVTMAEAVAAVHGAFRGMVRGEFELPHRTALADGAFLSMAVHHRPSETAVTKTLSLSPGRSPAIVGTLAWTGLTHTDTLAIEAGPLTSLRTAAVVGVATDLLAPPQARRLVLIGAGGMAADQVRAVHAVRTLKQVRIVARRPERGAEVAASLAEELPGVDIDVASDSAVDICEADIVCCATSSTEPLFSADALAEQAHVNAVGSYRPSMRELPTELLGHARLVVVDQRSAALAEAGEVIDAVEAGVLAETDLLELGSLLNLAASESPGSAAGGRTVFKSVGLAIQDWAIAHLLAQRLLE